MSNAMTIEIDNGLATLTLARGDKGNPMDADFAKALQACLDKIDADGTVRAILMRSNGANFCFGGDVKEMLATVDQLSVMLVDGFPALNAALDRLFAYPLPLVVEARGWVAGGGSGFASNADVIVGGEGTQIYAAFAGIALSNDSGSTWGTAARMGIARARRFYLENQKLNAQEALAAGYLDYVVPDDELEAFALKTARKFAEGPGISYAGIKEAFRKMSGRSMMDSLVQEAENMRAIAVSTDAPEGIKALAEKRKPNYQGK